MVEVGHPGGTFAFDNETPRHRCWLAPFQIADRLVTCSEYVDFIADGGYKTPALWLSEGWAVVQSSGWQMPAYWIAPRDSGVPAEGWQVFGLAGLAQREYRPMLDDPQFVGRFRCPGGGEFLHRVPGWFVVDPAETADLHS